MNNEICSFSHLTCSCGVSQLSASDRMISLWSCNRNRHSSVRLHAYRCQSGMTGGRKEEVTSQARTPLHLLELSKLDLAHFKQLIPSLL